MYKDIFLKTPLLIYFNFFQKFFSPKLKLPNSGCGLSESAAYKPEFTVLVLSSVENLQKVKLKEFCYVS